MANLTVYVEKHTPNSGEKGEEEEVEEEEKEEKEVEKTAEAVEMSLLRWYSKLTEGQQSLQEQWLL